MAKVTITLTDLEEEDRMEIHIESDPPFDLDAGVTSAQAVGLKATKYITGLGEGEDE